MKTPDMTASGKSAGTSEDAHLESAAKTASDASREFMSRKNVAPKQNTDVRNRLLSSRMTTPPPA
jgi:hypothetical protein